LKLITAALLALSTLAFAQAPEPPVVRAALYDALRQFLVLSDAQMASLQQLQKDRQQAERNIYTQISERQTQLNQLLAAGSNDAATVGRLMVEINNLRKQLTTAGAPFRESAVKLLNDAQRTKLAELTRVLELQRTAGEAVSLNLIDYPRIPEPRILPVLANALSATVYSEP
jgi:hypothetical protein